MEYVAVLAHEGQATTVEFPDCPGCATFADPGEDVYLVAREALEGWLDAYMLDGSAPPRPSYKPRAEEWVLRIAPALSVSARVLIRWARAAAELSQGQLAERLGMTRQQMSKIESPESNLMIATLERVAEGLGVQWDLNLTYRSALKD